MNRVGNKLGNSRDRQVIPVNTLPMNEKPIANHVPRPLLGNASSSDSLRSGLHSDSGATALDLPGYLPLRGDPRPARRQQVGTVWPIREVRDAHSGSGNSPKSKQGRGWAFIERHPNLIGLTTFCASAGVLVELITALH